MKFVGIPCLALLCSVSCYVDRFVDFEDILIPVPGRQQLADWQARYEAGEKWLANPAEVADRALRNNLYVPWKYQPFRQKDFELKENERWGTHVVRGFYTRDLKRRYRVKIRPYQDIWYAIEISHYAKMTEPHPALQKSPDD